MFFFFNDTATTEIYTLSLHDALPISPKPESLIDSAGGLSSIVWTVAAQRAPTHVRARQTDAPQIAKRSRKLMKHRTRSEEHTSELQSQSNLVCRLLLEKKKKPQQLLSAVLGSLQDDYPYLHYNICSMQVGNFLDVIYDGQSTITQKSDRETDPYCHSLV